MLKKRIVRYLKPLLLIVAILIFYFLIKKSGIESFTNIIKKLFFPLFIVALLFWILNLMVSALRFKNIISTELKYLEILKIQLWGFLLNYASFIQGIGMGAKIGLLKTKQVKIIKSAAGIGSEIIYDIIFALFVSIIFFIILGKTILYRFISNNNFNISLLVVILIVLFILIFIFRSNKHFQELISNLSGSFSFKTFPKIFFLTSLIWVLAATKTFFIFKAAGIDMDFLLILSALSVGFIIGLITLIPGGLGVRESIWAYIYTLSGISLTTAIPIAIIDRVFSIGAIFLFVIVLELFSRKS